MKEKKIDFTKKIFMLSLLVIISITWFFLLFRLDSIVSRLVSIVKSIRAIIYGIVIAYLLNPILMSSKRFVLRYLENKNININKIKLAKVISIITTVLVGMFILVMICLVILPNIYTTLADLLPQLPTLIDGYMKDLSIKLNSNKLLQRAMVHLEEWFDTNAMSTSNNILAYVTKSILDLTRATLDVVIGMIVAVYAFMEKEKFVAQAKKAMYALFNIKSANYILDTARYAHKIFSGFLLGKIIDSVIVGLICYPVLSIMHMPYVLLISVIIGITNIIPYFGPFIGAVPATILVFLVDCKKSLYFLIFIIILQQIDGNIIGPKILKNKTNVSEFWVTFALLLAGGIWGFVGMIIGVPLFAVMYSIIKHIIEKLLLDKQLPTDSTSYVNAKNVDEEKHVLVYNDNVT